MRFRLTTAYGDPEAPLVTDDLLTWLRWSKTVRPETSPAAGTGRG